MKVNLGEELMEEKEEKIIRNETLLWIKKLDMWQCYDHDEQGNRIDMGTFRDDSTRSQIDYSKRLVENQSIKSQRIEDRRDKRPQTKYRGVNLHTQAYRAGREKIWQSGIRLNGKRVHFGTFCTDHEAALAYDKGVRGLPVDRKLNFS